MNSSQPTPTPEEKSPFEFWAAYLPGAGDQKFYLSNGKTGRDKGLRLFKSQAAAETFLKEEFEAGRLRQEIYDKIVVHPIEGKLALPAELDQLPKKPARLPFRLRAPDHLKPIMTTLHLPSQPTAVELLASYERRKKRRRRH